MRSVLAILLISLSAGKAYCWGALAHRATGYIAWSFLDTDARNRVNEILHNQDIGDVATWADSARANNEWKFTIWYHFEKAPDDYTYLDNLRRQDEKYRKLGGLIEALYVAEDNLKNPATSDQDRENALKFVIHFVGDIHQPLHTGRVEDNSGNKIPINWQGRQTTLHAVWDSQMIYLAHQDLWAPNDQYSTQAQHYADYLMTKFKDLQPTPNMFVRYDDWMHESMIPRKDAYDYKDESEDAYTKRFINTVDERVYMAGLRIAYVVNRLVKSETPTEPLQQLRSAIESIVGDFTQFVSLRPRF